LLHVRVSCRSLASHIILKVSKETKDNGREVWIVGMLVRSPSSRSAVNESLVQIGSMGPGVVMPNDDALAQHPRPRAKNGLP